MSKKYLSENAELMKDWDWEANKDLNPAEITCGSNKKVWWKCSKCGYKWQTAVKDRCLSHHGCSVCSRRILVVGKNDLLTVRPDIAAQWHPFKNGNLKPQDVTYGWGKKVWWKCSKCGYEWQSTPNNRTRKSDDKCPYCVNKVCISGKNDLLTTNPELAEEWHPIKNGSLRPENVSRGSSKRVWWKCPHGHEYIAGVSNRTHGTNCPICNVGRNTSFAEQAFYYYIKQLFPDAVNQYKADFLGLMELDIFIPSIRYAIEYDGKPWHGKGFKGKREREERKYSICTQNNIKLIRIREGTIDTDTIIADYQFEVSHLNRRNYLDNTIKSVLKHILEKQSVIINDISVNTERDRFKILSMMNVVRRNNSLAEQYPELAKEWHLLKNENLTPYMFMPGSKVKVWWVCSICGNEYQQTINHRSSRGQGCPICGIDKRVQKQSVPIYMLDKMTSKVIKKFSSIHEAAREMGITSSNISMVCTGQRKTAGGYKWQFLDTPKHKKARKTKIVYMISVSTHEIIKKFTSVREASEEMGVYEGSIRKVCMGNRETALGYIWRYEGEEDKKYQKNKKQLDFDFE